MKLGVYGHGPQSKRYLDPKNWPDGVEVVQLERAEIAGVGISGVIVASRPSDRGECMLRLSQYMPVLCEKPLSLSLVEAGHILAHFRKSLVAHTHLWAHGFCELVPSRHAMVKWCGEERADGSCPAMLDWGPHAWSMAIALGTDRVITGKGDRYGNVAKSRGKEYPDPDSCATERPMRAMLATFASLIDGGYDWRAEPDFALEVHRRCFSPWRCFRP